MEANIQQLRQRIASACTAAQRPVQSVTLVAVTKTVSAERVRQANNLGVNCFGENYAAEGVEKVAALADVRAQIARHFIGPLQSNKTRLVAEQFDWVHSIDRLKVAQRLSEQRPATLPPLQVLLQVNVSGEASKSGVAPNDVADLAARVAELRGLQLRGLMAIPALSVDPVQQRQPYQLLRHLQSALRAHGHALDQLSMGMSDDFEIAISEGATLVRIGTALFGPRSAQQA